jgi:hypothetical protein
VDSYWIVVPDVSQPELIVFELRDGRYEQVAHVTGSETFRAKRPSRSRSSRRAWWPACFRAEFRPAGRGRRSQVTWARVAGKS